MIPTVMSKARRLLMGKCNISSNETQDQRPLTTASFAFISSFSLAAKRPAVVCSAWLDGWVIALTCQHDDRASYELADRRR